MSVPGSTLQAMRKGVLSQESVVKAIKEYDQLGRENFLTTYHYGHAQSYVLVHDGKEYDSKAIAGVAHKYEYERALTPDEFSGGREGAAAWLERLGFHVRTGNDPDPSWRLEPGEPIRRVELHDRYGGSRQGGICPSSQTPNVLIFTDPGSGHQHGYYDEWAEDGTFHYTGFGQTGDQTFVSGNKAIRDHVHESRHLRLFQGSRGTVRYVGEFVLDSATPWSYGRAPETGGGAERQVIRFHMVRVGAPVQRPDVPVGAEYRTADEDVVPAPATPAPNTELNGRNLRAHRRLQNQLATTLRGADLDPLSPSPADPDFDIAWRPDPDCLTVCEIKSLTKANETAQLRMGIGQLLDYIDQLQHRAKTVVGVLWVERAPADERWIALCQRAGICLAWPGRENDVLTAKV
jgi:hypothetical protein